MINEIPSAWRSLFDRFLNLIKFGSVVAMVLLLWIPLTMIGELLKERLVRRNEAVTEITSTWGKEQTLVGPLLVVPYRSPSTTTMNKAYFLPEKLEIAGTMDPKVLQRGIFDAVVYGGTLKYSGQFAAPDFSALQIDPKDVDWEHATVVLSISDLRGTRGQPRLTWGDKQIPLELGTGAASAPSGLHAKLAGGPALSDGTKFSLDIGLNGSRRIQFAPVGAETTVQLQSKWPDPGFQGAYLPSERNVTPEGFETKWEISPYGRGYPQQGRDPGDGAYPKQVFESTPVFGVELLPPMDAYRNVERAIKYGILFIAMVFTTFFLFETVSSLRIHPIQYALVGAALCLFYLSLLSLSEFLRFPLAYAIASVSATAMVSLYSHKVLRSGRRTSVIVCMLMAIYGFLYVTLQLQDYSLLFGTVGLFVMLAIVMYATRNIDWYAGESTEAGSGH